MEKIQQFFKYLDSRIDEIVQSLINQIDEQNEQRI